MTAEHILADHDLRKTKVRVAVLDTYLSHKTAISHPDMEAMLPDLDRVTLFRTLKTFEEKGIIHQAIDGTAATKYALCHADCSEENHYDNHAHFHCTNCGDTICLEDIEVPTVELPTGYRMQTAQLVMQGTCVKCR